MFAITCRKRVRVPRTDEIFVGTQSFVPKNAVFAKLFSSSDVNGGDPNQSFTVSYLINSCGLSTKDAVSVSKKLCIKSKEKSDAVLKLLKKYGFTNDHISRLVKRCPRVLQCCPNKTLLPKREFFRSIGVLLAVSAEKLSSYPSILLRSLENLLIPMYGYLKSVVQSDENVVKVFVRNPWLFGHAYQRLMSSNIAILREREVPESSIVTLVLRQPSLLTHGKQTFTLYVNRATEMGFDNSRFVFIHALEVFGQMSESTLKHKMDVYRSCGWSESDVTAAFLKHPLCMKLSEEKIRATMDFLVNEIGVEPFVVAENPVLLSCSLKKGIRPRWRVIRILKAKGLVKKSTDFTSVLMMSEEKFVNRYILDHQEDIPQLLDIYQGKLSLSEIGFDQDLISK